MFDVGNICVKTAGRDAGKYCIIIEKMDDGYVMIDGQTRRRKCNVDHLEPTEKIADIKAKADNKAVVAALNKAGFETIEKKVSGKKPTQRQKKEKKKSTPKVAEKPKKEVKAEKKEDVKVEKVEAKPEPVTKEEPAKKEKKAEEKPAKKEVKVEKKPVSKVAKQSKLTDSKKE